jgi:ABC-2 type transport system permease protein
MMKALLKNQWKIFWNTARTQPKVNYISYLVLFIVLFIVLYWLVLGVGAIGDAITKPILTGLLSYGFLLVIGFIILLSLPQVFKHLYSATDLNLLFTMPIPTRYIFWIKYIQSFVGAPIILFILSIVPLYVYGLYAGVHFLYYPVVLLILLSVIVIGLSIAYLFNLVLVQIIPASRANEFMSVMSVFAGLFVYLLFFLPGRANEAPLSEVILSGLPLFPEWFPVTWASNAITQASTGSLSFFIPFLMTLVLAIIFILITSTLVDKGFRTGWVKLSEGSGKKRKMNTRKKPVPKLNHPVIAVGKKEWFALKRDMREWLSFFPIFIFIFVFLFSGFVSGEGSLNDLRDIPEIVWPFSQVLLLFMFAMINAQFASFSIAREAKSTWILEILPLSGKEIVFGKLWISWLVPFVFLTVIEIAAGIYFGWALLPFIGGILMKAVLTVGMSGIGMWFGAIGAKYNPENPQNRLRFAPAILMMIASFVYLFLALIPFVILLLPVEAMAFVQEVSNTYGFIGTAGSFIYTVLTWKEVNEFLVMAGGFILMLAVSFGIAYLCALLSAHRIERGFDIEMVQTAAAKPLFGKRSGRL